ncbi:MAG: flp pilus-assembly TadE/G-like family protein [Propionibacteriaceae bacterium]|jgi:secretion/DNA translocation related TadE-like protein|nr:flp pilus-assembly TadE/G-like family protein [Propionibacteriaceae bacterium]
MRDERGSGTVLIMAAIIIGCLLAVALLGGGAYSARLQQVSQAADLVAISAAEKDCAAAKGVAERNQVKLESCQYHGDAFDQVVSVTVAADFAIFGLSHQVTQLAYAGRLAK